MEEQVQVSTASQPAGPKGFGHDLAWFFSGAVLPMASLTYYRRAARRSTGLAVLFFITFMLAASAINTFTIIRGLAVFEREIQNAYDQGLLPDIVIRNGVAEMEGPQPFVLLDDYGNDGRILVAADTSGTLTEIDRAIYAQGFLLTKTDLHMWNNGEYNVIPLTDINRTFEQDPLYINRETTSKAWELFGAVFALATFIFLLLWDGLVRLMFIAAFALALWGLMSLIRPGANFGQVLSGGLYAAVPAIYLTYLFKQSELYIPGMWTMFLLIYWILALASGSIPAFKEERPVRLWTAWIGVPLLVLISVDKIVDIPAPYGVASLWLVTVITLIALAGLRIFLRYRDGRAQAQPASSEPS
jgi:hypothetical protein